MVDSRRKASGLRFTSFQKRRELPRLLHVMSASARALLIMWNEIATATSGRQHQNFTKSSSLVQIDGGAYTVSGAW